MGLDQTSSSMAFSTTTLHIFFFPQVHCGTGSNPFLHGLLNNHSPYLLLPAGPLWDWIKSVPPWPSQQPLSISSSSPRSIVGLDQIRSSMAFSTTTLHIFFFPQVHCGTGSNQFLHGLLNNHSPYLLLPAGPLWDWIKPVPPWPSQQPLSISSSSRRSIVGLDQIRSSMAFSTTTLHIFFFPQVHCGTGSNQFLHGLLNNHSPYLLLPAGPLWDWIKSVPPWPSQQPLSISSSSRRSIVGLDQTSSSMAFSTTTRHIFFFQQVHCGTESNQFLHGLLNNHSPYLLLPAGPLWDWIKSVPPWPSQQPLSISSSSPRSIVGLDQIRSSMAFSTTTLHIFFFPQVHCGTGSNPFLHGLLNNHSPYLLLPAGPLWDWIKPVPPWPSQQPLSISSRRSIVGLDQISSSMAFSTTTLHIFFFPQVHCVTGSNQFLHGLLNNHSPYLPAGPLWDWIKSVPPWPSQQPLSISSCSRRSIVGLDQTSSSMAFSTTTLHIFFFPQVHCGTGSNQFLHGLLNNHSPYLLLPAGPLCDWIKPVPPWPSQQPLSISSRRSIVGLDQISSSMAFSTTTLHIFFFPQVHCGTGSNQFLHGLLNNHSPYLLLPPGPLWDWIKPVPPWPS